MKRLNNFFYDKNDIGGASPTAERTPADTLAYLNEGKDKRDDKKAMRILQKWIDKGYSDLDGNGEISKEERRIIDRSNQLKKQGYISVTGNDIVTDEDVKKQPPTKGFWHPTAPTQNTPEIIEEWQKKQEEKKSGKTTPLFATADGTNAMDGLRGAIGAAYDKFNDKLHEPIGKNKDKPSSENLDKDADNLLEKGDEAIENSDAMEFSKRLIDLYKESAENKIDPHYIEELPKGIWRDYKSGKFGKVGSKDARHTLGYFLLGEFGNALSNMSKVIKGGEQTKSQYAEHRGKMLEAAAQRYNDKWKNIADETANIIGKTAEEKKNLKIELNKMYQDARLRPILQDMKIDDLSRMIKLHGTLDASAWDLLVNMLVNAGTDENALSNVYGVVKDLVK